MQKSNNHRTIKLSPTVEAALKPHSLPSYSKEDLWQLTRKCVMTLICKNPPALTMPRCSRFYRRAYGALRLFRIFMCTPLHYEDERRYFAQITHFERCDKQNNEVITLSLTCNPSINLKNLPSARFHLFPHSLYVHPHMHIKYGAHI